MSGITFSFGSTSMDVSYCEPYYYCVATTANDGSDTQGTNGVNEGSLINGYITIDSNVSYSTINLLIIGSGGGGGGCFEYSDPDAGKPETVYGGGAGGSGGLSIITIPISDIAGNIIYFYLPGGGGGAGYGQDLNNDPNRSGGGGCAGNAGASQGTTQGSYSLPQEPNGAPYGGNNIYADISYCSISLSQIVVFFTGGGQGGTGAQNNYPSAGTGGPPFYFTSGDGSPLDTLPSGVTVINYLGNDGSNNSVQGSIGFLGEYIFPNATTSPFTITVSNNVNANACGNGGISFANTTNNAMESYGGNAGLIGAYLS